MLTDGFEDLIQDDFLLATHAAETAKNVVEGNDDDHALERS